VSRISRSDLRELLLSTGEAILLEEGVGCGLDHLTFPRVFDRVEAQHGRRITRASVYDRVWANQADYQWDVLARVVSTPPAIEDWTYERIRHVLAAADLSSEDGRLATMGELCGLAVEQHVNEASRRQKDRIAIAALGAVASAADGLTDPDGAERVHDALRQRLENETEETIELFGEIGARLGFRMREPLELRQLVLVINALGEGIAIRMNFFPDYAAPIVMPSPVEGEPDVVWSLAGRGVEAIASSMLELDPDWVAPSS